MPTAPILMSWCLYEAVVNEILDDLVGACKPRYMSVTGEFSTRGGMNSTIYAEYEKEPSK